MKLQTHIPLPKEQNPIGYASKLLLLGSCFVENIGDKLGYYKFQTEQNPFGILFHPLAIEKLLTKALKDQEYSEKDIFFFNERWHCLDAHSNLSSSNKEELLHKLALGLKQTREQLQKASHIILTLGTAWVYTFKETQQVVANCHKIPQKQFSKRLLSAAEIQESCGRIIALIRHINQGASIVITVSPVRHLKDGFVENQRSKAHLITGVHSGIEHAKLPLSVSYFPSYEIMMDELRDYRFYKQDMVHPNALAIAYIWEKFVEVWIAKDAQNVMDKVAQVQKGIQHRPFNSDSLEHKSFLKALEKKKTYLEQTYPFMKFNP